MTGKNEGNWFDDDPEWVELRQRLNKKSTAPKIGHDHDIVTPKSKPKFILPPDQPTDSKSSGKNHQISVNITVPKIKVPRIKRPKRLPRKVLLSGGVGLCAVIAIGVATLVFSDNRSKNKPEETTAVLSDKATEPEFKTILPDGEKDGVQNAKVAYDPEKKVASYQDKIGLADITVSQQPLPDKFKADPEQELEKLAISFSANEVILTSNPKVYLGTSVKGPQTVIFYRYDVLVFIQASRKIDKQDWTDYIRSLKYE
jgi:hypothetical protein